MRSLGATRPAGEKHSCRLSDALSTITSGPIQPGTKIPTGLTWPEIEPLFCADYNYMYSCPFCNRINNDHNPSRRPYWEREDTPYSEAVKFLSKAQLILCFKTRGNSRAYPSLTIGTEMNNPDFHQVKKTGENFELVGHFRDPGQRTGPQVLARRLVPATFDASTLQAWLSTCEHHHKHGEMQQDPADASVAALIAKSRLRLIDVWTHVLVSVTAPKRYIALSYVWGKTNHMAPLPKAAYELSRDGHQIERWENLPRTIRDAAQIIRSIGERYLWVDAICINQSDPEDQRHLVSEMGGIYGSSLVTIIATGDCADSGLAGVAQGSRKGGTCTDITVGREVVHLVRPLETMKDALAKTRWDTRGWTFQELVLSRRAVVFAPDQAYFLCAEGEQAEAYPDVGLFSDQYRQDHPHRQRTSTKPAHKLAIKMIEEYSRRDLTHIQDRFDAFIGAATIQHPVAVSPETCVTLRGLPLHYFFESLLWETRPQSARSGHSNEVCTRIESSFGKTSLPSWSWVGWTGDVDFHNYFNWPSTTKPRIQAILLDSANIVLKPATGAKQFPFWEPWPFEPKPHTSKIPNTVTLHMWAPCIECHFVPYEPVDSGISWAAPRSDDEVFCAILLVSPELDQYKLDALAGGRGDEEFHWRKDRIGTTIRSRAVQQTHANPQRQIHRMAVFARDNDNAALILLEANPKDPDTVCRGALETVFAVGMDVDRGKPGGYRQGSGLDRAIWKHTKHRYIRMQ